MFKIVQIRLIKPLNFNFSYFFIKIVKLYNLPKLIEIFTLDIYLDLSSPM